MSEKTFISVVESDQNDIHNEIFNLEDKNNQDIGEEIKENTCHNPSPERSKQNAKLKTEPDENNSHTRSHVEETPHEGKNDAEIIAIEDEELKDGTNETIGQQEKILSQNYKCNWFQNPHNDFLVLIFFCLKQPTIGTITRCTTH